MPAAPAGRSRQARDAARLAAALATTYSLLRWEGLADAGRRPGLERLPGTNVMVSLFYLRLGTRRPCTGLHTKVPW